MPALGERRGECSVAGDAHQRLVQLRKGEAVRWSEGSKRERRRIHPAFDPDHHPVSRSAPCPYETWVGTRARGDRYTACPTCGDGDRERDESRPPDHHATA